MYLDDAEKEELVLQLAAMRLEHRDLDESIIRLSEGPFLDHMQIRRLKKRKLRLRDEIKRLESLLIPDEPA